MTSATTTDEATVAVEATTTEGDSVVIEGTVVEPTEGPAAGEESSSTAIAVQPAEVSDLSKGEARKLADKIKKGLNGAADLTERMNNSVETAAELMAEAYSKRIWLALGRDTWEDFVSSELGEVRVRLERGVRQGLVYRMVEQSHMSTRAIAPVFGVDQKTVSNDVRQIRRELGVEAPTKVRGKDDKEYAATQTRQRKPKPVTDRFAETADKVDKAIGDLVSFSTEEGFSEVAGEIAKAHRADLARWLDSLKGIQDRLQ